MSRIKSYKSGIRVVFYLLILFLGLWAFYLEPSYFRIQEYKINISALNLKSPYRVAIIGDLHVGSPHHSTDKIRKIVSQVNQSKVDLIVIVGDLVVQGVVGGEFVPPAEISKILSGLRATDGVFGVLGNHDWWHDAREITRVMEESGIKMIDETFVTIPGRFHLMGVGDYMEGNPKPQITFQKIPKDLPTIAITHNPDIFPEIPLKVVLTLAGHTHGGQVYFPLIGRLIVPSKYGAKYAVGAIFENGHHLFVSTGVGTSILPVRFLVPPEVSILEIY